MNLYNTIPINALDLVRPIHYVAKSNMRIEVPVEKNRVLALHFGRGRTLVWIFFSCNVDQVSLPIYTGPLNRLSFSHLRKMIDSISDPNLYPDRAGGGEGNLGNQCDKGYTVQTAMSQDTNSSTGCHGWSRTIVKDHCNFLTSSLSHIY